MVLKMALRIGSETVPKGRCLTYRIRLNLTESLPGVLLLISGSAVLLMEGGVRHGRRILGRLSLSGGLIRNAVWSSASGARHGLFLGGTERGLGSAMGIGHGLRVLKKSRLAKKGSVALGATRFGKRRGE
jgi:hypothetical protein